MARIYIRSVSLSSIDYNVPASHPSFDMLLNTFAEQRNSLFLKLKLRMFTGLRLKEYWLILCAECRALLALCKCVECELVYTFTFMQVITKRSKITCLRIERVTRWSTSLRASLRASLVGLLIHNWSKVLNWTLIWHLIYRNGRKKATV